MHLPSDAKKSFQSSLIFGFFFQNFVPTTLTMSNLRPSTFYPSKLSLSNPVKMWYKTVEICFLRKSMHLLSDARKLLLNFTNLPGEAPGPPSPISRLYGVPVIGPSATNILPPKLILLVSLCDQNSGKNGVIHIIR